MGTIILGVSTRKEAKFENGGVNYRSIIESVLLYGSDTWVLKGTATLHRLATFHRRCARFFTGQFIHPQENGEWVYPHTEDVFKKAGLESIESCIGKRRVHVAKYFTPESKAITEIANSLNIELNMEKVSWWKPTNPDQNHSLDPIGLLYI